jgi:hypothetical protein
MRVRSPFKGWTTRAAGAALLPDVLVEPADAPEGFGFDLNLEKAGDEWLVDRGVRARSARRESRAPAPGA